MKVVDIIEQSALLLGLNDERQLLNESTEEQENELLTNKSISTLFNLIKYSIQELCTNYIPVLESINLTSTDLKIPVSCLTNYIRVQNVTKNNEIVKHKIINRNLVFEEDGNYCVNYQTYPKINSLFEEIDFLSNFSEDVIVYGLCAYYSLSTGLFDEFEKFHEEYLNKAENLKELKSFYIPQRRWE